MSKIWCNNDGLHFFYHDYHNLYTLISFTPLPFTLSFHFIKFRHVLNLLKFQQKKWYEGGKKVKWTAWHFKQLNNEWHLIKLAVLFDFMFCKQLEELSFSFNNKLNSKVEIFFILNLGAVWEKGNMNWNSMIVLQSITFLIFFRMIKNTLS